MAEQALPELTRMPAASNRSSSSPLVKPGTEKFSVVGSVRASGALNTSPGRAA